MLNFTESAINNRVAKVGVGAYLSTPQTTTIAVVDTYQRLEGIFTNNVLEGFFIDTENDNKLTYHPDDGAARTFAIIVPVSIKSDTVNTTCVVSLESGNGTTATIDGSEVTIRTDTADVYRNGTIVIPVAVEDGDTIEIQIKADKTADITPEKCNPLMIKMF